MGGRARGRQNRSSHRRLLAATEPLTVAAMACSARPGGLAFRLPPSSTSPLGVPVVTPPTILPDPRIRDRGPT